MVEATILLVCMYVSIHVTDITIVITIAMCSEIITINHIIDNH